MENLFIHPTESTPKISFDSDKHLLEIRGSSYLENTAEFYAPVVSWFNTYLKQLYDETVVVNIELVYFNSSSSRILVELFENLNEKASYGNISVDVNWLYEPEDEDMRDFGREFQEDYSGILFHFIEGEN